MSRSAPAAGPRAGALRPIILGLDRVRDIGELIVLWLAVGLLAALQGLGVPSDQALHPLLPLVSGQRVGCAEASVVDLLAAWYHGRGDCLHAVVLVLFEGALGGLLARLHAAFGA